MSKSLSYEEKLELIRLWQEENYSIRMLCEHFGVVKSVVERWRKRYLIHGEKGLISKSTNAPYSEEEKQKIEKELEHLDSEIKRASSMLSNPNFVNKAPEAKVNAERDKLEAYTNQYKSLKERLENLGK